MVCEMDEGPDYKVVRPFFPFMLSRDPRDQGSTSLLYTGEFSYRGDFGFGVRSVSISEGGFVIIPRKSLRPSNLLSATNE